jgi:hypothetical protein
MSWLRDDDDMLDHEKWRRAIRDGGDGALLVWARLRAWCSRRLTDGVIPADMVDEVAEIGRSKSRSRALHALVAHALCAWREDGALTICGYLERNPSKARVLEERERRSEAQRKRRVGPNVTGHAMSSYPDCNEVPAQSRPGPIPAPEEEREPARVSVVPEVPGLLRVGGSRFITLPSEEPPKAYLDDAAMAAVPREQAISTWKYYWGAGLPPGGVEKLHPWLVQRAKERANQLARAPKSGPRTAPDDGSPQWDRRNIDVRHRSACERYGLSVDATVSDFLRSGKGTGPPAEVDREFGKFIRERGKGAQAREVGT